jgi:outer membrane protein, heavy metal efflux system
MVAGVGFEPATSGYEFLTAAISYLRVQKVHKRCAAAYLRPNPGMTLTMEGTQIAPNNGVWKPLAGTFYSPSFSYLHERDHKRELRLESAKEGTRISQSQ